MLLDALLLSIAPLAMLMQDSEASLAFISRYWSLGKTEGPGLMTSQKLEQKSGADTVKQSMQQKAHQ